MLAHMSQPREALTGVDDMLIVQVSETGKSIIYDGLSGDQRKSCGVDMEQSFFEIGEDEHIPLKNAIHGCSYIRRVFDAFL
ncbi:putative serine threonine protein kinase [Rosellinia necatrix]|uniref:Putative serine threonine protein kinase n=1 Tax=Rosellinia necatrix TaxID=77044 RepID=A0A1S8AAW9_ROSNE|nr:putative serine threonine protein kinase [Rosellinia necatrix]